MEQIVLFAPFVLGGLLTLVLEQWIKIKELKRWNQIAENEIKITKDMYGHQISMLKNQIELMERARKHNSIYLRENFVSDDIVSAVKYAMKHAHPDNGGNAEDFMKFKKCYEELARK